MNDKLRADSHYLFLALALVAVCMLCALALPVFDRAAAQTAKFNGKIAFVTNRNGPPGEIYVMNPDGSDQRNITKSPASETRPAFSPDGKKIAFVRDFNGIFVMNPDGSGQTQILDGPSMGFSSGSISSFPDWSPDGKKIVFNGAMKGSLNGADIYVINADGTGLTQLTTDPADDGSPVWSPDGTRIAFGSIRDRVPGEVNYEIYVMNADGSNQTRLTNNTKFDTGPAWSPDGTRIAFTSRRDGNFEVYVMNADGSNQTRLTFDGEQDSDPKWSPDGTKIAFLSCRGGRFGEIWTMNPDGTGLVNVTNADGFDMDPSWQAVSTPFVPSSPTPTPTPTATPTPDPFGLIWQPFIPSPAQTSLDILTCGGRTFAKVKITFSDTSYRVVDWGQIQKTNNHFLVDIKAEHFTNGGAAQVIVQVDKVYDLGVLGPGSYDFTVTSRNAVVQSKAFNVGGVSPLSPADDAAVFVSQHYADFLGRNPDDQGIEFWIRNMTFGCGTDAVCVERKRIDTSAAFFLSIEFQRTGFMVYRLYRASYGRMPRREEFLPDARTAASGVIVNMPGWEAALADNQRAFVDDWVNHPEFKFDFDQLSNDQFVDRLVANMGSTLAPGTRAALVDDLAAGRQTRAAVLRTIVDDDSFAAKEFNAAFVLMQYFGYLQRNPDQAPDTDMRGFNFWLTKLNQFGGDYVKADMVKAFITSSEYRARFCSQ
jgi:Tol biopolymer transport system component